MKRSLALGALMAFVITGSAWAAELSFDSGVFENEYVFAGDRGFDDNWNGISNNGTLNISGNASFKSSDVMGGDVYGGSAYDNIVNISGGNITGGTIRGGSAKNAYRNVVNISDGFVDSSVYGGMSNEPNSKVYDNTVNISGGTVKGRVFGGFGSNAYNNVINISGKAFVDGADLYGCFKNESGTFTGSNNNLNIKGAWEGSIGSAQNFNVINITEGAKATFKTALNDADVTVNVKGATWNVDKANTVGSASFDASSVLSIDGDAFEAKDSNNVYALNGNGTGTLTVANGATLAIKGIDYKKYNVAEGFTSIVDGNGNKFADGDEYWKLENTLMEGVWTNDNGLQVQIKAKEAEDLAEDMGVSVNVANTMTDIITAANENKNIKPGTPQAGVVEFANALADAAPEVAGQAVEAVVKMAEEVGQSAIAASIVKNVTDITNDRLSFNCGHSAPQKGGHGVGLLEEGSGAAVWVEYVHGKDEVENMKSTAGATSYEGQYNGFVMGVDFKKVNKFQSGIAFNYGEGDTNSVGSLTRTHSDYDFWGVGYYGNIHNDDINVIFDINYAKTDSDVTQKNLTGDIEASPEATTWTAGVKVEKLYQNENLRIVPYTGLRYMSIDADDYSTKCGTYNYKMERKDIWLLPVGVSIKQEVANDNGWTVSPRVDLSYIWAFGDTDSNMGFGHALDNKITNIGYDVMDDGSFLGLVGIEAHKGQWGFGVSYSYQKGDHSESKKWYVDVNYSF